MLNSGEGGGAHTAAACHRSRACWSWLATLPPLPPTRNAGVGAAQDSGHQHPVCRWALLAGRVLIHEAHAPPTDLEPNALPSCPPHPVLLCKAAAPHLNPGGSIIFVSSYTAFNPAPPIAM